MKKKNLLRIPCSLMVSKSDKIRTTNFMWIAAAHWIIRVGRENKKSDRNIKFIRYTEKFLATQLPQATSHVQILWIYSLRCKNYVNFEKLVSSRLWANNSIKERKYVYVNTQIEFKRKLWIRCAHLPSFSICRLALECFWMVKPFQIVFIFCGEVCFLFAPIFRFAFSL